MVMRSGEKQILILFTLFCVALVFVFINDDGSEETVAELEKRVSGEKSQNEEIRKLIDKLEEKLSKINDVELDDSLQKPDVPRKFIPHVDVRLTPNSKKIDFSALRCDLNTSIVPTPDIQMLDVLSALPFNNKDGGVWKQGFDITYNQSQWNTTNKLKVFIVMHSHNDPGWLNTFDQYYDQQTKFIFEHMLKYLIANGRLKFIWAEIVYFSKWFDSLDSVNKETVRRLVGNNQIEFVTGGWVMPDEAASHWYSVLIALTEGQTWLKQNFNITRVKSSWAIDPFGHSSSLPYLLKLAGFENLLIQRTHYSIKKHLARQQQLEFRWRQLWDLRGNTDLFTHMMPFYSYDIPHTCGPDPSVCCQFDFRRHYCPWKIPPTAISMENIESKSEALVDQWKKKAQLFKTNSLLTPLGDDFTYAMDYEWKNQTENYEKLIDHINLDPSFNVEVKFATLSDYFESVKRERSETQFSSLTGDFFTYSDRDSHYWSGYFTSRPYYKRTDRILMNYLRTAEMLHSLADFSSTPHFDSKLEYARRALAIFQHHDGVSGTARDHVMNDYNLMMAEGIENSKFVIQQSLYKLLTDPINYAPDFSPKYFDFDDSSSAGGGEKARMLISVREEATFLVIHNSQTYARSEIVDFLVDSDRACVSDASGRMLEAQIAPVWRYAENGSTIKIERKKFRLLFKAQVASLGIAIYNVTRNKNCSQTSVSNVRIYTNLVNRTTPEYAGLVSFFIPSFNSMRLNDLDVQFSPNGLTQMIVTSAGTHMISINFLIYGTKETESQYSGAYIFMPDGPAQPLRLDSTSTVVVIEGSLETSLTTNLPYVTHSLILRSDSKAIEIRNLVDVRGLRNTEIVMRVSSSVSSFNTFYTDLNGLQYVKRKILGLVPLPGNYYPVNSGIFIEDDSTRISLLTATPLGGSSLDSGQLEVMQDRRLNQDDARGLGQGVMDNQPVLNIFRLLIESRGNCKYSNEKYPMGFLTREAFKEQKRLLHPLTKLISARELKAPNSIESGHEDYEDFELVTMRKVNHVQENAIGVVVHRTSFESCLRDEGERKLNLKRLLLLGSKEVFRSSVTLLESKEKVLVDEIPMCPMDTLGFILK